MIYQVGVIFFAIAGTNTILLLGSSYSNSNTSPRNNASCRIASYKSSVSNKDSKLSDQKEE